MSRGILSLYSTLVPLRLHPDSTPGFTHKKISRRSTKTTDLIKPLVKDDCCVVLAVGARGFVVQSFFTNTYNFR